MSIEPGLQLGVIELVAIDAGLDGGADQDFATGVVFAGAAVGEGARAGVDALLPDFKLFEFRFQLADALVEFGHGVAPLTGVQWRGHRFDGGALVVPRGLWSGHLLTVACG